MAQVQVVKKSIDPLTGSDIVTKRFFNIDENNPNNSLEYHKFADLLGVNRLERLNPHLSGELALLYNWASNKTKSNDLDKMGRFIDKARQGQNILGPELVKNLYRMARFDMQSAEYEGKDKASDNNENRLAKEYRKDSSKAEDLRNQKEILHEIKSKNARKVGRITAKTYRDFEKDLPKERNLKVKILEPDTSGPVLVNVS